MYISGYPYHTCLAHHMSDVTWYGADMISVYVYVRLSSLVYFYYLYGFYRTHLIEIRELSPILNVISVIMINAAKCSLVKDGCYK